MSSTAEQPEFSRLRRIFFPIHTYELKKVIPMSLIFFFILVNYTLLRNVKDSLVVTAPNSGAEVLSFLKLFCVTPAAILFIVVYAKASSVLSNEKLFYWTISPFIVFFGLFAFVIYPNISIFQPSVESVAALQEAFPRYKWIIAMFGNWTFSLFYILAELWGSAIVSLSFWQFANQITKLSESRRHYAFFGLCAQIALVAAGLTGRYFSSSTGNGADAWGESLNWICGGVCVFGIAIMAIYRWIYTNVLTDKRFYDKPELPGCSGGKKKKAKVSLGQSFKIIFTSPYIGLIAVLVMSYGISINFVEGVWKSQLKLRYPNPNAYNTFMSNWTLLMGFVSMGMMIVGSNILRMFRWFTAAVITPVMLLILGGSFFGFVLFRDQLAGMLEYFGTTPLIMAVMFGATVNMIIKSTKYALFDLTKEMAYIPLDEEMKVKGKAVVDVLGSRLGKSGGAGFQTLMFLLMPGATYFQIAPYVAGAFVVICVAWILAVRGLSKRVEAISNEPAKDPAAEGEKAKA